MERLTAYDGAFAQHLADHNILKSLDDEYPDNWADIHLRMAQPRRSLSPSVFSEADFEEFKKANWKESSEQMIWTTTFLIIIESVTIPHAQGLHFENPKKLTNNNIVDVESDFYNGCNPSELSKKVVRSWTSILYQRPTKACLAFQRSLQK